MPMKYIRFEMNGFVLFQTSTAHTDVADKYAFDTPVSAGFVQNVDGKIVCYGKSEGLKLPSNENDSEALARRFLD